MAGQTTTVLTANLCLLCAGLTNRRLPIYLQAGPLLFVVPALLLALHGGLPWWVCLLCLPAAYGVLMLALGVPLARVVGLALRWCGFDDFKRERVDLFLRALRERPEWAGVDVICLQECYSCLLCPGGYPEQLAQGARALGFRHVAMPGRCPACPATLAQNSGLMILSKRAIRRQASKAFGFSLEAANVNRGALYAQLEDGTHVFTCHISPACSVMGSGPHVRAVAPLVDLARARQVEELLAFVETCAARWEPAIIAGDFNFDISFQPYGGDPLLCARVEGVLCALRARCGLVEATGQIRRAQGGGEAGDHAMRFCRPTFAYPGGGLGDAAQGPAERWLTSYGDGTLQQKCDDAVFFRGFVGVSVAEENMLIPSHLRPHSQVTHLTDHWGLRVVLRSEGRTAEDSSAGGPPRSQVVQRASKSNESS